MVDYPSLGSACARPEFEGRWPDRHHTIDMWVALMSESRTREAGLEPFVEGRGELIALSERIVGSHAVAEEVVQESWLRWNGQNYPADSARSVVISIVRNLAYDWLRRRRRERVALGVTAAQSEVPDTERIAIDREDVARVAEALAELPERSRQAFFLSRIEGLSHAEIGRRLGISKPRAHQLVHRALLHIARRLQADSP